jgi:ABC-type Na+ efflux pump permease subunit
LTRRSYLLLVLGFPLFLFLNLLVLQATAPQPLPSGEGVFQLLLTRYLPILLTLLLYGSILMASNTLLNGLSDEKRNRVMEVLLLSVEPHQLLTGKFIALALAGLLQVASWGGIGYLIFVLGGRQLDLSGISLPPVLPR